MRKPDAITKAKQLKKLYETEWMELEDVVAVGIGIVDDKTGIIISVKGNALSVSEKIPSEINGIQIKIMESGEIRAQ